MRQKNGITYQLNPLPVRTNFTSPFEATRITGLSTINRKINNCTQWQIPLHGLPQQSGQKLFIASNNFTPQNSSQSGNFA